MLINTTFFSNKNGQIAENAGEEKKYPLSIAIIQTILLALVLVLGLNTCLILIAQTIHIPFRTYLTISPMISLFGIFSAGWIGFHRIKNAVIKDYDVLVKLFLLSLICAFLILMSPQALNNGDNYLYIPNTIYFLDHPDQPLDFQIHFFVGESGNPIISPNQATSLAYEYFRAVFAYYLNIEYLGSYFYSGAVMGLFLPLTFFFLITHFVEDTRQAALGTVASIALILISIDSSRTFGSLSFNQAYLGKFLFLSTGIPLFSAYSISFFQKPSKIGWLSLLFSTLAFVGMTASATVLLAVLAMLLLSTFIITSWINTGRSFDWKNILLHAGLYISSLAFIFLYALFLYGMLKTGITTGNYSALDGSKSFLYQVETFSDLSFPLTLILMALSPVLVLTFSKGWQRQFLLLWIALLVILFLNPLGIKLFIDLIVPSNIYWRLFFLFPFPLSIGFVASKLPLSHKVRYAFEIGVILFTVAIYIMGRPGLTFSYYETRVKNLGIAQKIVAIAPPGPMLAPSQLYGIIPMIDGFHPQISMRIDSNTLWLTDPNENTMRRNASLFAGGKVKFIEDFSTFVTKDLARTIVLNRVVFGNALEQNIKAILQKNGFTHQKQIGNYVIFWK